jgi:ADP-ribose pyrophosphatase YjhB (NUDIX family)
MQKGVDYIGVTCGCLCRHPDGRILLQKRGPKNCDEVGTWDVGGGAVEFGEHPEDAMKREMKEELGIELKDVEFLGVNTLLRDNNDGKKTHWICFSYTGIVTNPNDIVILEDGTVDDFGWFDIKTLPNPLHTIVPMVLKMKENKKDS